LVEWDAKRCSAAPTLLELLVHAILHVFNHWAQHSTDGAVKRFIRKVDDVLRDAPAKEELRKLI
jgi:hypothetical protein